MRSRCFGLSQVEDLRGSPMGVGSLEEIIDDNHAIVSSAVGAEYYVSICSFVDKDALEPVCSLSLIFLRADARRTAS